MLLLFIAGCGSDQPAERSDVRQAAAQAPIVRSCDTRVEGRLAPDWRRKSVIAGPLAFAYGRELGRHENRAQLVDEKMLVVLRARHEATVVVAPSERGRVSLDYDFGKRNHFPLRLSDGAGAVQFIACRGDEKTYSPSYSLRRETQFNGGIIAHWPSCVELDVFIDGRDTPVRSTIPFGNNRCDGIE